MLKENQNVNASKMIKQEKWVEISSFVIFHKKPDIWGYYYLLIIRNEILLSSS